MFFILPIGMDYRARRYPVVTFTLMGICSAIYLITLIFTLADQSDSTQAWVFENLWLIPSESHWWTYLTSVFVHSGFFHLFGNMIYLFLFGACVEDMIGRLHFTLFYPLCGIGAALAYVMFSPEHFASDIPMGGASGAISGCIGGYLLLRAKAKIQFKWLVFFWFRVWHGDFQLPAWLVISFWFLEDLAKMLLSASKHGHGGGVAFGAHVGGTLVGMGLMAVEKIRLKNVPPVDDEELEDTPIATTPSARPIFQPRVQPATVPTATFKLPTILLFCNGAQSGPFTQSKIQQMFAAGEIPVDAVYWQEGMTDWRTVEELLEL
ncbi:MAG: Rhomboid-like protein [Pedosphaera sp.]|nr:Rhomboid-like protein [Pedosphaera sp.]